MEFITNFTTGALGPYSLYIIIGAAVLMVVAFVGFLTLVVVAGKRARLLRRARDSARQAETRTRSETAQPEDASDELEPAENIPQAKANSEIKEVQASIDEPVKSELQSPPEPVVETEAVEEEAVNREAPPASVQAEPAEATEPVSQATAPPAAAPVKFQDFSDLRPAHFETFQGDEWDADLDQAGDDEVIHHAGEVENEPASVYLDLNRRDEYHQQQYNRARGLFHHQLRNAVHGTIEPEAIFRPGMTGRPVPDTFPAIFWKDAALFFDDEAHRRADAIIPELYFHAVRHEGFHPADSELDADVLAAIVNYSLWKGKRNWIHTLAFRMLEDEIPFPGLWAAAALTARAIGRRAEADFFINRVRDKSLYLEACFHALGPVGERGAPMRSRLEDLEDEDRLRLDWFAAAAGNDYLRENAVVDELIATARDINAVLDIVRGLLLRGRLFKAVRLLDKHGADNADFKRIVLQLHFRNGKNNHFLRRLYRDHTPLTRGHWYEIHYAVRLLGGNEAKAESIFAKLAATRGGASPPERDQAKFIRHLRAVDAGRFDPAAATPVKYGDVLAHSLFYVQRGRVLNDSEKQKEHVRRILKVFRNNLEDVQDLFRLEILLRSVFWSFMFIRERDLVRRFLPYLESMAGRNQALRIFVGLYYGENGHATQAVQYLQHAPRHPLVLHRLADIYAGTGDTREAENAYQALLAEYPNEATFWFNYGLLLEKNEKRAEANRAYHRALDINPDLHSARERISALLEMKAG